MDQSSRSNRTVVLTGTAILAALVVIFDYALKYSGLKIPFPWMPSLKFDFTGIPIVLSLLLYGERKVVHVAESVPPCKAEPCPVYSPMRRAAFVVELSAGQARREKAVVGSAVRFALP